jgi:hypothetical protein
LILLMLLRTLLCDSIRHQIIDFYNTLPYTCCMKVVGMFRMFGVKAGISLLLALHFLNFSINTVDREYRSQHQTSAALEIETLTELILDEVFDLDHLIADGEEHDHEQIRTSGQLIFSVASIPGFDFSNNAIRTLPTTYFISDLIQSRKNDTLSPPPKAA